MVYRLVNGGDGAINRASSLVYIVVHSLDCFEAGFHYAIGQQGWFSWQNRRVLGAAN